MIRRRTRRDEGAVAVYAAIVAPALAVALMFFVDAACRWNTWRDANAAAEAAARAGAQWSPEEFVNGHVVITTGRAQQRASAVLAASGYTGTAQVIPGDPPLVTVTVTASVDYVFVGGLGASVTGTGEAEARSGVSGG